MIKFSESGFKNDPENRKDSSCCGHSGVEIGPEYVGSEYYAQLIRFGQQALLTIH